MVDFRVYLKAGDPVYVGRHPRGFGGTRYVKATVVKVTPSGMVDARMNGSQADMRFRADGREQGGDAYYGHFLEHDVAKVEKILAERDADRAAADAIREVKKAAETMRDQCSPEFALQQLLLLERAISEAKAKLIVNASK